MKINLDTSNEDARIEIIPLIDVIFCILTFFLLAALQLTRQQAISVNLPKAKTGVPQMREMLFVTLDDYHLVYVEKQLLTSIEQLNSSKEQKYQLSQILKNYHSTNPNGLMVLYASKSASYNDVVQLLDLLREVGGDRVALATLPASSQPNPNTVVPPIPGANPLNPYNPYGVPLNPSQPQQPVNPGQIPGGQGTPKR